MSLQGFDQSYYLNAKLAYLQAGSATSAAWVGKTVDNVLAAIVAAGQTAESNYINYGYKEGLNPNALFDAGQYEDAKALSLFTAGGYASVAAAKAAFIAALGVSDPYQHYLTYGAKEGINPSTGFDSSAYLAAKLLSLQTNASTTVTWSGKTSADLLTFLLANGLTPLSHYLGYGVSEGIGYTPGTGVYTLTAGNDTRTANIFNAPQVYTPGGNDRINSLQDEDRLTGTGTNPTLNVTLGNHNDNGLTTIAPVLSGIKIVNIDVTDTDSSMTLDFNDSDATLTDVNVTRINSAASDVINLHKEAVNLSASNTHALAALNFTYINSELVGTSDTVNLTLKNVNATSLYLGSQTTAPFTTNQIETVNLTVATNGPSSIASVDLGADKKIDTFQRLNITANAELIIGDDVNGNATGALHDLGIIEHNNGFVDSTVSSLNKITVAGAGNVTLGNVGSATGFILDGATATGNIAVNITNSATDATASFTTGSGNDTVITGAEGTGATLSVVSFAGALETGAGSDVVKITGDLLAGSVENGYDFASISTSAGDDTVTVGKLAGFSGVPLVADYDGAYINVGEGDNTVNADSLGTEARIIAGAGKDVVTLTEHGTSGSGAGIEAYTAIVGDAAVDADKNGAEVVLGAGTDNLNIVLSGTGLVDATGGTSLITGYVDGGSGSDTISVTGNKSGGSFAGLLEVVTGNTGHNVAGHTVENVETLNLTSTTAYGTAGRVADFNSLANRTRTLVANDDNSSTANYSVNRAEFDSSLATINLIHQDGVIRNIAVEDTVWHGLAGSTASDYLYNLTGAEVITISALEAQTISGGTGTGNVSANDTLGTVYAAGPFQADLTAVIRHDATSTDKVAEITLNNVPALADPANSPLDPGDVNYDVSIGDLNAFYGSGVAYTSLVLTVNGNDKHGVNLNNDFATALTVTGDGTGGGNLTIVNVNAATIQTGGADLLGGYKGNVYLGVESAGTHHITTGIGDDIVRLGDETAIQLVRDVVSYTQYVDLGSGNDTVIFNGLAADDANHAGLTEADTVIGGAGNDVLAFGGVSAVTPDTLNTVGVTIGHSEWTHVSGFETIQLSVGQAVPQTTSDGLGAAQTGINNYADYYLEITNDLIDANGGDVLHIVNNNVKDGGFDGELTDGTNLHTVNSNVTASIHEGNTTLDLRGLSAFNHITYDGATNVEGGSGSGHGSNDRFIFANAGLNSDDSINGGAADDSSVTGGGNRDILEVRNTAEVTTADLLHIDNVGNIVFNSDNSATLQRLTLTLDNATVDNLVDNHHSATAIDSETLYILANDFTTSTSFIPSGAALTVAAGTLGAAFNLNITLDDQYRVTPLIAHTTLDIITTGSGADVVHGAWSSSSLAIGDQLNLGAGNDIVYVSQFGFDDYNDAQLQGVDHWIAATDQNINLSEQSENLDITISYGSGAGLNTAEVIGGSGAYGDHATYNTLTFTSNYSDQGGTGGDHIQYIHNLKLDGRTFGVDDLTGHSAISVNIAAQSEAFNITMSDNGDTLVSGLGADSIAGGAVAGTGVESITGAAGNDTITLNTTNTGHSGIVFNDYATSGISGIGTTLVSADGVDTITGFDGDLDKLVFSEDGFHNDFNGGGTIGSVAGGTQIVASHIGLVATTNVALDAANVGTLGTTALSITGTNGAIIVVGTNAGVGSADIYFELSATDGGVITNTLAQEVAAGHAVLLAHVTTVGHVFQTNDFVAIA